VGHPGRESSTDQGAFGLPGRAGHPAPDDVTSPDAIADKSGTDEETEGRTACPRAETGTEAHTGTDPDATRDDDHGHEVSSDNVVQRTTAEHWVGG
jgi:hypothetical protein